MNELARRAWARTSVKVWPAAYRLATVSRGHALQAAALVRECAGEFTSFICEGEDVTVVVPAEAWQQSSLRRHARGDEGPYRVLTCDVELDLDLVGYLAPAAARLAEAGISLIPQCGFRTDHLVVKEADLPRAQAVLDALIRESRGD